MSKTPFEIRLDLLNMAQSILLEKLMNERIRQENDWGLEREKASTMLSKSDFPQDVKLPPYPEVPNIDVAEVISLAQKLNNFVSRE